MLKGTTGRQVKAGETLTWKTHISEGQHCWPRRCRHAPLTTYWQTWMKRLWRAFVGKDEQRRVTQKRNCSEEFTENGDERDEVEKSLLHVCSCLCLLTHSDFNICIASVWLLLWLFKGKLSSTNQTAYLASTYLKPMVLKRLRFSKDVSEPHCWASGFEAESWYKNDWLASYSHQPSDVMGMCLTVLVTNSKIG